MPKFNSDLQNLFSNFKNQQKYAKKAYDANNDGSIDNKDKEFLLEQEKALLDKKSIFDVNGDGIFDKSDIDMFVKGDVDGLCGTTKLEKAFVSKYKDNIKEIMYNYRTDFSINGQSYSRTATNITKNISDCNLRVYNYNKNGKPESQYLEIVSNKTNQRYTISAIPEGLDIKNITRVTSNDAGATFTIYTDEKTYVFERTLSEKNHFVYGSASTAMTQTRVVSGCDVNTVTKFDEKGKETANYIRIIGRTSGTEYQINSIPEGLDVSKIEKIASMGTTFTITTDDSTEYTFNRTLVGEDGTFEYNIDYQVTYDNMKNPKKKIEYGKTFTKTYTYENSNGNGWTGLTQEYKNGCRTEYTRKFDKDGKYIKEEKNIIMKVI